MLKAEGVRENFKVLVGGGQVSRAFATGIEADGDELGKGACIGTAAHLLEGRELHYEVRPAKPPNGFMIAIVCGGAIARYYARGDSTEHRGEDGRAAAGSGMEINRKRGYEAPEGSALPLGFSACFVDIEVVVAASTKGYGTVSRASPFAFLSAVFKCRSRLLMKSSRNCEN